MEIAWIMGGFFAFLTLIFIAIAVLAPEVLGIQGKVARKIEASHQSSDEASNMDEKKT